MYRIIGADGKEYGPVTATQLRQWIAEGRVNAETRAQAEGSLEWRPLGAVPEFSLLFHAAAPPRLGVPPPPSVPARQTNPSAVAGLVFGILSLSLCFCCYGFPFNVLGLIFSIVGLTQIRNHPHLYDGEGLAIAGIILSALSLALALGLMAFWRFNMRGPFFIHRYYRL